VNQIELLPVVLQVAVHAIFSIRILHLHMEVIAVFVGEVFGDFLVAVEAFKCGSAGPENVAGVALSCSGERGMGFGEWARGYLGR
jgi:hypothetical protein